MYVSPLYHNTRPEGELLPQEAAAFDWLERLKIDYERVSSDAADNMEKCDVSAQCWECPCARTCSCATAKRRASICSVCRRTSPFTPRI